MAYCTTEAVLVMLKADVISSLIGKEEYLPSEERTALITPIAEAAAQDADAEIDGYLCKRYPVPLASVPTMITKLSKDIAVYNLMSRSGIDEGEGEANYLTRYKAAIKYLTLAAEGKLDVEQQGGGAASPQGGTFIFGSNKPLFGRNKMRGM